MTDPTDQPLLEQPYKGSRVMPSPEDQARENIDRMLAKSGWAVQDPGNVHLSAYRGLAIRNFTLKQGHEFADYLLYVDGRAAGVVEAKKEGVTLTGVETQSEKRQKSSFDPRNQYLSARPIFVFIFANSSWPRPAGQSGN